MIFKIQKLSLKQTRITYECHSFTKAICKYWEFLNQWAVVKNERAEAVYSLCYDGDAAVLQEDKLTEETGVLMDVLTKMIDMLEDAQLKDDQLY